MKKANVNYEYEVAFSVKEIIAALVQDAVNHGRLPVGAVMSTLDTINDGGELVSIIIKANKVDTAY